MAPRPAITETQRKVLAFVADCIAGGLPPTLRQISEGALNSRSPNAAAEVMKRLERKGLIERVRKQARHVRLTKKGQIALLEVA